MSEWDISFISSMAAFNSCVSAAWFCFRLFIFCIWTRIVSMSSFILFKLFSMFSVALALLTASFLTSSATTPKPLPCSPAHAASIAALSPKRLVCPAISLIKSEMTFVSSALLFALLAASDDWSCAAAFLCLACDRIHSSYHVSHGLNNLFFFFFIMNVSHSSAHLYWYSSSIP